MKLHAQFPTILRGIMLDAEVIGDVQQRGVNLSVSFKKDGKPYDMGTLTREELAALCREAAASKRCS